ncbi:uncharacterized protein EV420DRAFT_1483497 [Desarmillaria tabescens]|uniref:Uncharacterized protein n=1 Tax=Armillaria tabescens TaxID=1929756 RepID=A0AA39MVJ8_ARMTA|nr:uncharacterized protein EV420DRAFT_1483497 [Desarmillaria tabescens]KAK0448247.1 hypothetical protein EV420DRAFT_1483497 [Desarmillaria tabescens]
MASKVIFPAQYSTTKFSLICCHGHKPRILLVILDGDVYGSWIRLGNAQSDEGVTARITVRDGLKETFGDGFSMDPMAFSLKCRLQELTFGIKQGSRAGFCADVTYCVLVSKARTVRRPESRGWDGGVWRIEGDCQRRLGDAQLISHSTLSRMKTSRTQNKVYFVLKRSIAVWRARPGLFGGRDEATMEGDVWGSAVWHRKTPGHRLTRLSLDEHPGSKVSFGQVGYLFMVTSAQTNACNLILNVFVGGGGPSSFSYIASKRDLNRVQIQSLNKITSANNSLVKICVELLKRRQNKMQTRIPVCGKLLLSVVKELWSELAGITFVTIITHRKKLGKCQQSIPLLATHSQLLELSNLGPVLLILYKLVHRSLDGLTPRFLYIGFGIGGEYFGVSGHLDIQEFLVTSRRGAFLQIYQDGAPPGFLGQSAQFGYPTKKDYHAWVGMRQAYRVLDMILLLRQKGEAQGIPLISGTRVVVPQNPRRHLRLQPRTQIGVNQSLLSLNWKLGSIFRFMDICPAAEQHFWTVVQIGEGAEGHSNNQVRLPVGIVGT